MSVQRGPLARLKTTGEAQKDWVHSRSTSNVGLYPRGASCSTSMELRLNSLVIMVFEIYFRRPKGPSTYLEIRRPQSTHIESTLRPKYII